jgi:hypothetical protein
LLVGFDAHGELTVTRQAIPTDWDFSITSASGATVQGAGEDLERRGQKVQDEAREHKPY